MGTKLKFHRGKRHFKALPRPPLSFVASPWYTMRSHTSHSRAEQSPIFVISFLMCCSQRFLQSRRRLWGCWILEIIDFFSKQDIKALDAACPENINHVCTLRAASLFLPCLYVQLWECRCRNPRRLVTSDFVVLKLETIPSNSGLTASVFLMIQLYRVQLCLSLPLLLLGSMYQWADMHRAFWFLDCK